MCFSIHITHSSVNFMWFSLLSYTKFNDRPRFKPGALCLIFHHFELRQNKYFYNIKIIFPMNQFQTIQIYGKNSEKKINFLFYKKFPLFIE